MKTVTPDIHSSISGCLLNSRETRGYFSKIDRNKTNVKLGITNNVSICEVDTTIAMVFASKKDQNKAIYLKKASNIQRRTHRVPLRTSRNIHSITAFSRKQTVSPTKPHYGSEEVHNVSTQFGQHSVASALQINSSDRHEKEANNATVHLRSPGHQDSISTQSSEPNSNSHLNPQKVFKDKLADISGNQLYRRPARFQNKKVSSNPATTRNKHHPSQITRKRQNRQDAITKPINVLSTVLPPALKKSISQSTQVLDADETKSTATVCPSAFFLPPDPYEPPPDKDNTSVWEAVMSTQQKATKSEAEVASTVAKSSGARGSAGYEIFLDKLGVTLDYHAKYTSAADGPNQHFKNHQGTSPVTRYATTYSGDKATKRAAHMLYYTSTKHSEADLCDYYKENIFPSGPELDFQPPLPGKSMPLDENAIVRRAEYNSSFHGWDISELRRGAAEIQHIRVSQKQRSEGHSTADTPNRLPAPTDLRGRCDVAFGVDEKCLEFLAQGDNRISVSCYDSSAGVASIWGRAEFKNKRDAALVRAATHQWAAGAFLELQARVRLARSKDSGPYLKEETSPKEIRHFGYIICGAEVDVWEMCVTCKKLAPKGGRRETFYQTHYFLFPAKKLASLNLTQPRGLELFCEWHTRIMTWGLNVYSRQYVDNINELYRSRLSPEHWTLSYEEAIGNEFPEEELTNSKL